MNEPQGCGHGVSASPDLPPTFQPSLYKVILHGDKFTLRSDQINKHHLRNNYIQDYPMLSLLGMDKGTGNACGLDMATLTGVTLIRVESAGHRTQDIHPVKKYQFPYLCTPTFKLADTQPFVQYNSYQMHTVLRMLRVFGRISHYS